MQQTIVVDPTIELPEGLIELLEDVDNEKAEKWFKTIGWEQVFISNKEPNFHTENCVWPKAQGRILITQYLIIVSNPSRQEYVPTIAKCPSCGGEVALQNYYGW